MKVAICLSGNLRDFKQAYFYLDKNLIGCNPDCEFDIYMHTWDVVIESKRHIDDVGTIDEALALYNPKKYEVEKYNLKKRKKLWDNCNVDLLPDYTRGYQKLKDPTREQHFNNIISMTYGWKRVNLLREKKYDLIIKTRYDFMFLSPLKMSFFSNDMKSIYIPMGYEPVYSTSIFTDMVSINIINEFNLGINVDGISFYYFNDFISIGNEDVIDIYCSIHDNIFNLVSMQEISNLRPICAHGWISRMLLNNNITANRFYMDHCIVNEKDINDKYNVVVTGFERNIVIPKIDGVIKLIPKVKDFDSTGNINWEWRYDRNRIQ